LILVEHFQLFQHLQRRADCPFAMVFIEDGRAEHGEQTVTDQLVDRPAVVRDGVEHQAEILVEQVNRLGRLLTFGDGGERADIREQHAGSHLLSAERKARAQ
jgi:hypothetical protein